MNAKPLELPFSNKIKDSKNICSDELKYYEYDISNEMLQKLSEKHNNKLGSNILWITAALIYFYRITKNTLFQVHISSPTIRNNYKYGDYCLLEANFKSEYTFFQVAKNINYQLQDLEQTCKNLKTEDSSIVADILIDYTNDVKNYKPGNNNFSLILVLDISQSKCKIFFKLATFTHEYAQTAIKNLPKNIEEILRGVLKNTKNSIDMLPIVAQNEKEQIFEWNNTFVPFQLEKTLPQIFQENIKFYSSKHAIRYLDNYLTYDELDKKANQLANYLLKVGVKAKQPIGVCLNPSVGLMITLLAILKSGAHYVPLAVGYPKERLNYILDDSHTNFIITSKQLTDQFSDINRQLLILDDIKGKVIMEETVAPHISLNGEDLAYIIYTSGSTGKPKGVMISHRSLINFLSSMAKQPGITCTDHVLAITTIGFDIAGLEMWLPLLHGALLVIAPFGVNLDGFLLSKLINDTGITIMQATPATWQILYDSGWKCDRKLKLLSGGDKLPQSLAKLLLDSGHELWNLYGPTETTIWSTAKHLLANEPITVGKPINNTKIYILDENLQLLPIGIPGELYIGGEGLSKGYLNQPDLIKEKFIINPIDKNIIYKTGDIAFYWSNGDIELVGRSDDQIKLNGYRIEIGEIESLLQNEENVHSAIVVASEVSPDNKQLIAYVIPHDGNQNHQKFELQAERVHHWNSIYSSIYAQPTQQKNSTFNIAGWKNSFNNQLISEEEMQEWVKYTIESIQKLNPRNVLEIGCGSGLLLTRIAPLCKEYVATDISIQAIDYIEKLKKSRSDLNHVSLLQTSADNLEDIIQDHFDVILINSVVQYFPDIDYFIKVLKSLIKFTKYGTSIFIGDVRNLTLLEAFHTQVKLHQCEQECISEVLQQRIKKEIDNEEELVISPEFFLQLKTILPEINHVTISVKRGNYHNELTCYRYDVVLYVNSQEMNLKTNEIIWIDHTSSNLLKLVREYLTNKKSNALGIKRVPNSRLSLINKFQKWVSNIQFNTLVREFTSFLKDDEAFDPTEFYQLSDLSSYGIEVSWANNYTDGSYDVVFFSKEVFSSTPFILFDEHRGVQLQNLSLCANNPLKKVIEKVTLEYLRSRLQKFLPKYMIPSHIVLLDKFPLTANGKIDKKALPIPDYSRSFIRTAYVPPQTQIEIMLADIWSDIFRIPFIGINDNFFELGGDSMMSIQIVSQTCKEGLNLRAEQILITPTIAELARIINMDSCVNNTQQERIIISPPPFSLITLSDTEYMKLQEKSLDVIDAYPLSSLQSGILFQILYQEDIYIIQGSFRLSGQLNIKLFQDAWQHVVQYHSALRSAIIWEDFSNPLQYVVSDIVLPWTESNWQGILPEQQEILIKETLKQDRLQGFYLNNAPLFRLHLIQLGQNKFHLIWTLHHIILDGWSLSLIIRDVYKVYNQLLENRQPLLKKQRPFCDYIQWLYLQDIVSAENFWRSYLQEFLTPSYLKIKKLNSSFENNNSFGYYLTELPKELTDEIKKFCKSYHITLNAVIQTSWGALLSKYTQQNDVIFGITTSGRSINLGGIAEMIGPFINTIPLRIKFLYQHNMLNIMKTVQKDIQNLLNHSYLPLSKIKACAEIEKTNDLFDTILVFENEAFDIQANCIIKDLKIETMQWVEQTEYPLTIGVVAGEKLQFKLVYKNNQYDEDFITQVSGHLKQILVNIVNNPYSNINNLEYLALHERNLLLEEWNNTIVDNNGYFRLHQLFEEQVYLIPDALAITYNSHQITYQELDRKVNQLANILQQHNLSLGSFIGICADRSPELVIGLLAILKAGCAYVPLDPSYPVNRLHYILNDTKASILLSTTKFKEKFSNHSGRYVIININNDIPDVSSQYSTEAITIEAKIHPETIAYVMYTSGSTGEPKGVLNSYRAIINRLLWTLSNYPIQTKDNFLQLATVGFDISIWEMLFPLSAGARLVILPADKHKDIEYLADIISKEKISIITFVPSLLSLLLEYANISKCSSIKQVVCGGELLSISLQEEFFKKLDATLYHAYGPTEAAISVTHWNCSSQHNGIRVPIGKPIANSRIYILDKNLNITPPGVPGELYIAGICLATGYLNKPDLTAQSFIANPFITSEKMYKSGDIACYLKDGNIDYLGRHDQQVKLHGHRIELSEIENRLRQHELVRDVLVMLREEVPGRRYLAAYVVSSAKPQLLDKELRELATINMPDYMIPSTFIFLEIWPLTPNGKIDRKALLMMKNLKNELKTTETHNIIEEKLLTIWYELFATLQINVNDNFFQLGGDSIVCIQLVSRARKVGIYFEVKDVFQAPTISSLAAIATQQINNKIDHIPKEDISNDSIPLTPIQRHFFRQKMINPDHFNQSILLNTSTNIDINICQLTLNYVINHHEMLRMSFNKQEDQWIQAITSISENKDPSYLLFNIEHIADHKRKSYIQDKTNEIQKTLNLSKGSLIKAALFYCGKGKKGQLFITIHHLAVDSISWRIFIEDLEQAYTQLALDQNVKLPTKTTSYALWATSLQKYADSKFILREMDYWKKQSVEGREIKLPIDFEKGQNNFDSISTISLSLSLHQTSDLIKNTFSSYRTDINTILLVVLAQSFYDWTGSSDLHLSLESHGRENILEDIDLSRTVGWFTSIYPILLSLNNPNDTSNTIKYVKEYLKSVPTRGIGYGIIRYLCTLEDSDRLLNNFSPPISFNYLGHFNSTSKQDKQFNLIDSNYGVAVAKDNLREHLIDIESMVFDGCLKISWIYSNNHFSKATIQKFVDKFDERLQFILQYCTNENNFGYVPSDFPLAKLKQEQLDEIFGHYKNIEDIYPLTPTQAGMLFQSLLQPESDIYFIQSVFELKGNINTNILQQAWQQVINQHSILRTGFIWENLDHPLQYVLQSVSLIWTQLDWSEGDKETNKIRLEEYLGIDRKNKFNLAFPPLLRIHLIKLSKQEFYMIWSQHHLLLDGWCLSIILNDVAKAYEMGTKNKTVSFRYRRPYRDYINWLSCQNLQEAEEFWNTYLYGLEQPTRLELNSSQPIDIGYKNYIYYLSKSQSLAITEFAKKQKFTLNTIFQCAWGLLLSRYTGLNDLVFGVTVSGRAIPLENIEEIMGLFINTIPLRFKIIEGDNVLSILERIQQEMSIIHKFSHTSLASIQAWQNVGEEKALFDNIFVFENYPISEYEEKNIAGLQLTGAQWFENTEYPLTITVLPSEMISLNISYQTARYSPQSIEKLITHLENLLGNMLTQPMGDIHRLQLFTNEELQSLLTICNGKEQYYPNLCLHRFFEQQVDISPDKIALVSKSNSLTYLELNEQANKLAYHLLNLGISPETLVGVSLERNVDLVVGLLAIIKAGGAYVPLDPHFPQERIKYMLEDTKLSVLLTQSSLVDKFTNYSGTVINIDQKEIIAQHPTTNIGDIVKPNNLLYVIYTSGSTGYPKGVMITHRNIVNFLTDMKSRLAVSKQDIWLSVTTISFDIAALEIYLPLILGAQVFIAQEEDINDPDKLIHLIDTTYCTVMQATPATWKMLISAGWERSSLLKVLSGGEMLSLELAKSLNKNGGIIWNLYGPTETTIWSTAKKIRVVDNSITIGRPIANTKIYILDENLQPTPIGIPGEIYIAGDGLSRGYLHRPDLNAEKFITISFFGTNPHIIYKTGDIGRYLDNGELECLGRSDHQIKLRGFRIELGEIESYLVKNEAVKQAVVIPYKVNDNDTKLIAHIIANKPNLESSIQFSLFYFADSSANTQDNSYYLYLESAKFADLKGFKAIWTPERHFHELGGQYPNPAVLNAGLATITNQIELRAGSVVLPLHNPLRVAEEWSVVDNLSQGRVGIAFASGWNPKDFAFFPENYQERKSIMLNYIEKVRILWRGEEISIVDGLNNECRVGIFPKPKQSELPIWITAAGGKETFIEAGKIGANVLTHLLGQNIEMLAEKISLYRSTLEEHGYNSQQYVVTVMLHTFVSNTTESALEISKKPFCNYLKSHISLENMAKSLGKSSIIESQSDTEDIIEAAFNRYSRTASLIGSVEDCLKIVSQLKRNGVDEIACLIDFGINEAQVLEGLNHLAILKERSGHIINLDSSKILNPLRNYLPEYMIPNGFVIHEKLPLTLNGKIDRKKLEQQSSHVLKSDVSIINPRTTVESLLAKIWTEVLGVEIKSIYDNFFTLGGHSLLATQAISKVRREFKIDVPLKSLFSNPTLVEFAGVVEGLEKIDKPYKEEVEHPFLTIQQQGYKPPLFLIYPGCGMPFAYLPLADYFIDRPIHALINPRFYELNNKFVSIEEMATYYCKVIKESGYAEPYSIGGWSFGGVVAYEMASILRKENILVETVIMIDSFNLSQINYKPGTENDILHNLKELNIDPARADAKYFKSEFIHNEKLLMNYKPLPYYGKVVLLKAKSPLSTQDYMHKLPYNGWKITKNMQFTKIIIPGNHNQFFSNPYIKDLVKIIVSILDREESFQKPKDLNLSTSVEIVKAKEKISY